MELKQILSTKKLDDKALILAHSLGMGITGVDFTQIKGLAFDFASLNGQLFDAIVFTSANGVKYFFENNGADKFLNSKVIFSLSEKTSSELLLHDIHADYVKKNAVDLAHAIIKAGKIKSVLHVCGNRRLDVLEEKLKSAGINYTTLLTYQTELKSTALNKNFDAILFYSPSGVESFFAANHPGDKTIFCCIGETTANALKVYHKDTNAILPEAPTPEAMIRLVGEYFRNNAATK